MANTLNPVAVESLSTTFAAIYEVPAGGVFSVSMLHIVNTSTTNATVSVCLVEPGGSPTAANALLWSFEVPARNFMELLKGDMWPEGAVLQARASATGVIALKLAGIETT